jgi:hypothetical protein
MKRVLMVVTVLCVMGLGMAVAGPLQEQAPPKAKLPPPVLQAVKANCPGAVIAKMDVEKEAGLVLYDIEFKAGRGEIEVAEDGTVMDVATIVALKDIPKAAADAILKAAGPAKIRQLEKSEVRAEIKKEGEKGAIVKLSPPKYVYEAELVEGEKRGEVQVAPDGTIGFEFKEVGQAEVPAAVALRYGADAVKWCFEENRQAKDR